jgi:hypothetical protein
VRRDGRPVVAAVTGLLAVGLLLGACSSAPADKTLPKEKAGTAPLYVALGGDDNGAGRRELADAWPQILFRTALPRGAVFVNLSVPRSGVAGILASELDEAVRLRPAVVTITLIDDAERATAASVVETDLTRIVDRLRVVRSVRILIGTIPGNVGNPGIAAGLDEVIARVATTTSTTLVDLGAVGAPGSGPEADQVARAFAAALRSVTLRISQSGSDTPGHRTRAGPTTGCDRLARCRST